MKYDIAIIGAGIGGLMVAYGLKVRNNDLNIAIIDRGKVIEERKCPAINGKPCMHCDVCSITSGFAGAGAFSDGKYNIGTSYGGTLANELGDDVAMEYINAANDVLDYFTPPDVVIPTFGTSEELKLKCLQSNLQLLDMNVKHFGTDNNLEIMSRLIDWLYNHYVDLLPNIEIKEIMKFNDGYRLISNGKEFFAENIILATGRNGADFIQRICKQFNVPIISNAVDIGVRVEMKDVIWREFSSQIYEPKILYKTKTFEDKTRMFCFNQGGIVSAENNGGVIVD